MKFFSVLASVFLLFFTSILILGVVSGSEYEVNNSITVEAPKVVVLKELIDFENYSKWCPNITKSTYNPETYFRQTTYLMDGRSVNIHEKVQIIFSENSILFTEHNSKPRGYIQNLVNEIHIKENLDGTTDIQWEIRYTIKPIISKILNLFVVRPALKRMVTENLNALQRKYE